MSLGWKKLNFFDKEELPDWEASDTATCSCSGQQQLFFGCSDGQVIVMDNQLHLQTSFQGFQAEILHIKLLQLAGQQTLVALGREDSSLSSTSLKVWNATGGVRSGAPVCLQTIKCFAARFPEAEVTALAVQELKWPQLSMAVGLANGQVLLIQGTKDRHNRKLLSVKGEVSDGDLITGLAFHGHGNDAALFAVTESRTLLFILRTAGKDLSAPLRACIQSKGDDGNQYAAQTVLDEMGASAGCTTVNQDQELVVGRPQAVYFYTPDGRGPCFVLEGKKGWLGWTRHYLVAVSTKQPEGMPAQHLLQVYDLRNKLIACSLTLAEEARHVVVAQGLVVVVLAPGTMICLREKPLSIKLELLFSKNLYDVALNLALSEQAEDSVLAEIQRRHGDHLYAKHDYDAAMGQYVGTIGHLEPSYVIRRFLDAQRIHNLTHYLDALHAQGKATADHTTLLLSCYTRLKDVHTLEAFLKGTGADGDGTQLQFDTETAVKVCRSAGYYEQALHVAQRAGEHEWYLDILLEDMSSWDEALAYLQALPRQQCAAALQKHGKALVLHRPENTTALLMRLCTLGDPAVVDGEWLAKVADFAHLYSDRPQALVLLCEYVLNSVRAPPSEEVIYHTLLQLYLQPRLADEDDTSASALATSQAARREKALELLNRGWPPGDEPRYDPDHALVLCRTSGCQAGLLFLYERLRLFREVLQVHMAADDYSALLDACERLGDAAKGGDPQLWTDVLEFFGSQSWDCSQQVQEVLGYVEAAGLLPPLGVLQALAKNPHLRLKVVKGYMERQLKAAASSIEDDRAAIARYQSETSAMRAEVHDLKSQGLTLDDFSDSAGFRRHGPQPPGTLMILLRLRGWQARVFQNSRCAATGLALELPAVHFLCGHSFNRAALGESEHECPLCADQFHHILSIQRSLHASAMEQDKFFTQLKSSADGFGVVAEFFGRGLLNASGTSGSAA